MMLSKLLVLLISLAGFVNASPGVLRNKAGISEDNRDLKKKDISIDREFDENGNLPEGRKVVLDGVHLIEDPPESEGDDHDRALAGVTCRYCWYNRYYGWITRCCNSYGRCGYYYC